jgi:hypothetical protein
MCGHISYWKTCQKNNGIDFEFHYQEIVALQVAMPMPIFLHNHNDGLMMGRNQSINTTRTAEIISTQVQNLHLLESSSPL